MNQLSPREINILIDALASPVGVSKVDRPMAQVLQDKLKRWVGKEPRPEIKGWIPSRWPQNHIIPDKKKAPKSAVIKDNKTKEKKETQVDNLLKGLL